MMAAQPRTPFILFADDDPNTLELLCAAARIRGWEYDTAMRAREVIEKFDRNCAQEGRCYDALILDINFRNNPDATRDDPRLTGITAVKEIRKVFSNIPIVFFTGATNTLVREQASIAGGPVSEFVSKPGDVTKLLDRVAILIALAGPTRYTGPERRSHRLNTTSFARRATDHPRIEVPAILETALALARRAAE